MDIKVSIISNRVSKRHLTTPLAKGMHAGIGTCHVGFFKSANERVQTRGGWAVYGKPSVSNLTFVSSIWELFRE